MIALLGFVLAVVVALGVVALICYDEWTDGGGR